MTKWMTFSHLPQRPNKSLPSVKLFSKLLLGVFCLAFFLSFQPDLGKFPPGGRSVVHAQTPEQTQTVQAQALSVVFQLPHPGYVSTHFSGWHPGVDIAMGLGTPIKPIEDGVITASGYNFWGLGLTVEIDHAGGYHSLYAHMGKIYVSKGQKVTKSDYLGEIGLTGHTTGPHTHLELSREGIKINPLTLLPPIGGEPKAEFLTSTQTNTPPTGGELQSQITEPITQNNPTKVSTSPLTLDASPFTLNPLTSLDLVSKALSTPKPEIKGLIKL